MAAGIVLEKNGQIVNLLAKENTEVEINNINSIKVTLENGAKFKQPLEILENNSDVKATFVDSEGNEISLILKGLNDILLTNDGVTPVFQVFEAGQTIASLITVDDLEAAAAGGELTSSQDGDGSGDGLLGGTDSGDLANGPGTGGPGVGAEALAADNNTAPIVFDVNEEALELRESSSTESEEDVNEINVFTGTLTVEDPDLEDEGLHVFTLVDGSISVLAFDEDGAPMEDVITLGEDILEADIILNSDGTYSITGNFNDLGKGETATVSFDYFATDAQGADSNIATVTLTIIGTNDRPVVENVDINGQIDTSVTVEGLNTFDETLGEDTVTDYTFGAPWDNAFAQIFEAQENNLNKLEMEIYENTSISSGGDLEDSIVVVYIKEILSDDGSGNITFGKTIYTSAEINLTELDGTPLSLENIDVPLTPGVKYAIEVESVSGAYEWEYSRSSGKDSINGLGMVQGEDFIGEDNNEYMERDNNLSVKLTYSGTDKIYETYDKEDVIGEDDTQDEENNVVLEEGQLTVTDDDDNDTHTFFMSNMDSAGNYNLGTEEEPMFVNVQFGNETGENLNPSDLDLDITINSDGSYSLGGDFNALAAGETATVTVAYYALDDSGASQTGDEIDEASKSEIKTITFTITGTNDQPIVDNVDAGEIDESHDSTDVIGEDDTKEDVTTFFESVLPPVEDDDVNDTHTYQLVNGTIAVDGELVENVEVIVNPDGTYSIEGDFNYLAKGESATVTFQYTATDDSVGIGESRVSEAKTVSLVINGTNDQPVVEDINLNEGYTDVLVMFNSQFSGTGSNSGDEAYTIKETILSQGYDVNLLTDTDSASFEEALSKTKVFVLPESERSSYSALPDSSESAIKEFVEAGGNLVVSGSSSSASFLNSLFGFSLNNESASGTYSSTPEKSGSIYDSVDSLSYANHTTGIQTSSLPVGTIVYFTDSDGSASVLFEIPYGTGKITFMGYDWYNAQPIGSLDNGWLEVLDLTIENSVKVVDENAFMETHDAVDYVGEDDTQDEPNNIFEGQLTVTDDDDNDTHEFFLASDGVTIVDTPLDSDDNPIITLKDLDVTINSDGSYTIDGDFSALAAGETATVTVEYYAVDSSSGSEEKNESEHKLITFTITGTNDQPIVQNVDAGRIDESHDSTDIAGEDDTQEDVLTTFNSTVSLSASDEDVNDTHTFNLVDATVRVNGVLSEDVTVIVNSDGSYSVSGDFNYLASGESATVTFQYTATDSSSGSEENNTSEPKTVTLVIDGTNDQPIVQNVDAGRIDESHDSTDVIGEDDTKEDVTTLFESTLPAVSDDDVNDTHTYDLVDGTIKVDGVVVDDVTVIVDSDGNYSIEGDFNYLAKGESATVTFQYTATDSSSGSEENNTSEPKTVTLVIDGTNDQPVVENIDLNKLESYEYTYQVGVVNSGVAADDGETGTGYMMYSTLDLNTRFSGLHPETAEQFITVKYENGKWIAFNNQTEVEFTPHPDDRLVAEIDFGADTVKMLSGITDSEYKINGISAGYVDGDLNIVANVWTSAPQHAGGEFGIEGTSFNVASGIIHETHDPVDYVGEDDTQDEAHNIFTGQLTVSDDDVNDTHEFFLASDGVTIVDTPLDSEDNSIITLKDLDVIINSDGSYTIDGDFSALAAGETATVTVEYYAVDSSTGSEEKNESEHKLITFTITGTNDQPIVQNVDAGRIDESHDATDIAGEDDTQEDVLTTFNSTVSLSASDEDVNDTHKFYLENDSIKVDGVSTNTVAVVVNQDGSYSVSGDFNYLASGESATVTFQYYAIDSSFPLVSVKENRVSELKTVTLVIDGTNDQPIVENVDAGRIDESHDSTDVIGEDDTKEDVTTLFESTLPAVSDDDVNDTHTYDLVDGTIKVDGVVVDDVTVIVDSDGNYSIEGDFNYLAKGESATVTFQYTATDSSSGSEENNTSEPKTVTLVIDGTNDQPVVEAINLNNEIDVNNLVDITTGLDASAFTKIGNGILGRGETPDKAFDDNIHTKYYNTFGPGGGLGIDAGESYVVRSLGLTTANDDHGRDPESFTLYGSNDGINFEIIASSDTLNSPVSRKTDYDTVSFDNDTAYRYYQVIFDSVEGASNNGVQVSEVRLFGAPTTIFETHDAVDIAGEDDTQDELNNVFTGQLTVSDDDENDTHTFYLASNGVVVTDTPTDSEDEDIITIDDISVIINSDGTYAIDGDFSALAAGETATVTVEYYAVDSSSGSEEKNESEHKLITFTITGTNDQPIVQNVDAGSIYETYDATDNKGEDDTREDVLTIFNSTVSLSVSDEDVNDTHTFDYVEDSVKVDGILTDDVEVTVDENGSYSIEGDFNYLAEGESATVTFQYTATDDSEGSEENNTSEPKTVTLVINGTNDQPDVEDVSVIGHETIDTDMDGLGLNGKTTLVTGSFLATSKDYVLDDDVSDTHEFIIDGLTMPNIGSTITIDGQVYMVVPVTVGSTNTQTIQPNPVLVAVRVDDSDVKMSDIQNLSIQVDGSSYTVSADVEGLPEGAQLDIKFQFKANDLNGFDGTDGLNENSVSELAWANTTIIGTNDAAEITGHAADSIDEDDTDGMIRGSLSISDVDAGEEYFDTTVTLESTVRSYEPTAHTEPLGTLTIDSDGNWTYTLDRANKGAEIEALDVGDTVVETYTVKAADGTPFTLTITINGQEDATTISVESGDSNYEIITEDNTPNTPTISTSGTLTIEDADHGEAQFSTSVSYVPQFSDGAQLGVLTIDSDGNWNYEVDNTDPRVEALNNGDSIRQVFEVESIDGTTSEEIVILIKGTNDAPVAVDDGITLTPLFSESFESIRTSSGWGIYGTSGTLTGDNGNIWTVVNGLEVQNGSVQTSTDGSSHAELDAYVNSTITTTIDTTNQDKVEISFDYYPRTNDSSSDMSFIFDSKTYNISYDGLVTPTEGINVELQSNGWFKVTAILEVTSNSSELSFSGEGSSDGMGALLDNINVIGLDIVSTEENTSLLIDVLANDSDVDNANISIDSFTQPIAGGTVQLVGDKLEFVPGTDFDHLQEGEKANVTFTYTVTDGDLTDTATVSLIVTGTNDIPTMTVDSKGVIEDVVGTASGHVVVVDADHDESGTQPTSYTGTYGDFSIDANGDWTYVLATSGPRADVIQALAMGEQVTDSFNVTSTDGTVTKPVVITVSGTNDQPSVEIVSDSVTESTVSNLTIVNGNLSAVTDVDNGDTHIYSQHGTDVKVASDDVDSSLLNGITVKVFGTGEYQVVGNFEALSDGDEATVTFKYVATDDSGAPNAQSEPKEVTVTITGTDDAPIVSSLTQITEEENNLAIFDSNDTNPVDENATYSGVLPSSQNDVNDTYNYIIDPTSVTSTIGASSVDANLTTVTINPNGSYTVYNPTFNNLATGESVEVAFKYIINDGTNGDIGTVILTVTGTNDAPVFDSGLAVDVSGSEDVAIAAIAANSGTITGDFDFEALVSDVDDSDADLHISTINGIAVDPATGWSGTVTFDYTDKDGNPATVTADLSMDSEGQYTITNIGDLNPIPSGQTAEASLTFKVADNEGAETATSKTINFSISGDNDAPVIDMSSAQTLVNDNTIKDIDLTAADFSDGFKFSADIYLDSNSDTFFRQWDNGSNTFLIEFGTQGFAPNGQYLQIYIPLQGSGIYKAESVTPIALDSWSNIELTYTPTGGAVLKVNGVDVALNVTGSPAGIMDNVTDSNYSVGSNRNESFNGEFKNVTLETLKDGKVVYDSEIENPTGDALVFDVMEGSQTIGTVGASDIDDATSSLTYSLVDANGDVLTNSIFHIDNNGNITVKDTETLDYEIASEHTLRVKVTDPHGASDIEVVRVNVNNITGTVSTVIISDSTSGIVGTMKGTGDADNVDGVFTKSYYVGIENSGESVNVTFTTETIGGNTWESTDPWHDWITVNGEQVNVEDGTHSYSVEATVDENGYVNLDFDAHITGNFFDTNNTNDEGVEIKNLQIELESSVLTFENDDSEINLANILSQANDFNEDLSNGNLDTLDLTSGDHILSNINVEDVLAMTDADHTLKIEGDNADEIKLDHTQWTKDAGQSTATTDVYTGTSLSGDTVTLLIEGVKVDEI